MNNPWNSILKGNSFYLLYFIVLFLSIIKNYLYYIKFDIFILEYLSISESLFYFVNDLVPLFAGFGAFIVVYFSINSIDSKDDPDSLFVKNLFQLKRFYDKMKPSYHTFLKWISIIIILLPIYFSMENYPFIFILIFSCGAAFCIYYVSMKASYFYLISNKDYGTNKYLIPYIAGFYIIYFLSINQINAANSMYKNIVTYKVTYGTTCSTPDTTYVSDSLCYYIGQTKGFVFFYNENQKITHVIPMEKVERLSIATNPKIKSSKGNFRSFFYMFLK